MRKETRSGLVGLIGLMGGELHVQFHMGVTLTKLELTEHSNASRPVS